jgi:hypothetical protein
VAWRCGHWVLVLNFCFLEPHPQQCTSLFWLSKGPESASSFNLVSSSFTLHIMYSIINRFKALVALQALSKPEDRAVATSTRNLMRMLGSVVGMALSTAIQSTVMKSALPVDLPSSIRAQVIAGSWERGQSSTRKWDPQILDAKMKGIRAVFFLLVPLVGLCLLGCLFIPNRELPGDPRRNENAEASGSQRAPP